MIRTISSSLIGLNATALANIAFHRDRHVLNEVAVVSCLLEPFQRGDLWIADPCVRRLEWPPRVDSSLLIGVISSLVNFRFCAGFSDAVSRRLSFARCLPASEKRQGTKSRGQCAEGSGGPMGNRRRRDGRPWPQ